MDGRVAMDYQEWMDQEVQMEIKEKMEHQGNLALMGDPEKKVFCWIYFSIVTFHHIFRCCWNSWNAW